MTSIVAQNDDPQGLRRSLGLLDVAALGINGVIGTGIFFLPGKVAAMLGPAALLTFLISALLCGLLVLCFAEMGSRFRATGGPMIYAEAAFGRTTGFAVGWLMWLKSVASWGALLNGLFTAAIAVVPAVEGYRLFFLGTSMAMFVGANVIGVTLASRMSNFFTVAKLLPILALIAAGIFRLNGGLFVPFAPHGLSNVGPATLVILYAFVGFETLTVPAGEMRDPARSVPRALFLVMGTATAVYLLLWAVCAGTLPDLAGAESPVADAAAILFGPVGGTLIALAIFVSVLGINAASALVTPRSLYALAHEGMLPAFLARVHPRSRTPIAAILVTAAITWVLAITGSFVELAVLSIAARLVSYVATCAAMLWFRARRPNESPAFRAPAGVAVAVLAIAICGWLIAESEPSHLVGGAVAVAVGLALHLPLRRRVGSEPE